jgi:hypothetical protein
LPEGGTRLASDARLIRGAFDRALAASQLTLSKAALGAVVGRSKRGLAAAGRAVAAMFQRRPDSAEAELPESERALVNEGAENVEHALSDPAVEREIVQFDERFDQELSRVGLATDPE